MKERRLDRKPRNPWLSESRSKPELGVRGPVGGSETKVIDQTSNGLEQGTKAIWENPTVK